MRVSSETDDTEQSSPEVARISGPVMPSIREIYHGMLEPDAVLMNTAADRNQDASLPKCSEIDVKTGT